MKNKKVKSTSFCQSLSIFGRRRRDSLATRCVASHLANIVVLVAYAWRAPNTPYLLTRSVALPPPPAALTSLPLAGARVQIFSDPPTQKAHLSVCFALAEKEYCTSCTQQNATRCNNIGYIRTKRNFKPRQ